LTKEGVGETTGRNATNYLRYYFLAWLQAGAPHYRVKPVILACVPGELNEVGLLMFGDLLRHLRWPVEYLGQSVSLPKLSSVVDGIDPSALVFFASSKEAARAIAEWPRWLPAAAQSGQPFVCFGGQAYVEHPQLIEQTAGEYLGDTLEGGVQKMDAKLHHLFPTVT
jgi:hypothetical protein